jgi:hypothetical protein
MRHFGQCAALALLAACLGTAEAQDKLPLVKVVATRARSPRRFRS